MDFTIGKSRFNRRDRLLFHWGRPTFDAMSPTHEVASQVGAALGRIPSGCSILTVSQEQRSTGVLVSWVQQASFQPPSVTVCLKQGRPALEWVDSSGRFLLNVIGEDSAQALFKHFGRGFALHEDAFAGLRVEPTEYGPRLIDAAAYLGCLVRQRVAVGDHELLVAEVAWGGIVKDVRPYVHIRKNGLNY